MMDIIEIDAASNTGVDNIRELIEKAQFQPSEGKYKVYIIDEVHMLTKSAFNALLKTLEEPPSHVKFILATTDVHKVLDTIISRTQRFDFRRISEADIVDRLSFIAESEGIDAEKDALALIARIAKGGLRDAISLFEQYSVGGTLTKNFIEENLSLVGEGFLSDYVSALLNKDAKKLFSLLQDLSLRSIDAGRFLEEILFFLRSELIRTVGTSEFIPYGRVFRAFESAYPKLRDYPDPFMLLEIASLSLVHNDGGIVESKVAKVPERTTPAPEMPSPPKEVPPVRKPNPPSPENPKAEMEAISAPIEEPKVPQKSAKGDPLPFDLRAFIEGLKEQKAKAFIVNALKKASFSILDGVVTFGISTEFERSKLDTVDVMSALVAASEACFSGAYQFAFTLSKTAPKSVQADEVADIF